MNCPRTLTTDTGPIHRTLLIKKNLCCKISNGPNSILAGGGGVWHKLGI